MEDLQKFLESVEEDNSAIQAANPQFISRVLQPDRISFSSYDGSFTVQANELNANFYNRFYIQLKNPIIDVKAIQLIRATIPNIQVNIPDTETVFWYYRASYADLSNGVGTALTRLHFVRLLPSTIPQDQHWGQGGFNQFFPTYQDLVKQLNKSCQTDPINVSYPSQTIYIPNDIEFGYDASQNKIFMNGKDVYNSLTNPNGYFYWPAPWNDPKIAFRTNQTNNTYKTFVTSNIGYELPPVQGVDFNTYRNLNLRTGFTTTIPVSRATISSELMNSIAQWRPVYPYVQFNTIYYTTENGVPYTNYSSTADTFGDLVYSANCHIYADCIASSAYTSDGQAQLLATVPVNTATLGVAQEIFSLYAPSIKTANNIYGIQFTLLTDTGEPFWLPRSAITNFEIRFAYE